VLCCLKRRVAQLRVSEGAHFFHFKREKKSIEKEVPNSLIELSGIEP
jgi:hypothetical protein